MNGLLIKSSFQLNHRRTGNALLSSFINIFRNGILFRNCIRIINVTVWWSCVIHLSFYTYLILFLFFEIKRISTNIRLKYHQPKILSKYVKTQLARNKKLLKKKSNLTHQKKKIVNNIADIVEFFRSVFFLF